jgi:hypothetical protein
VCSATLQASPCRGAERRGERFFALENLFLYGSPSAKCGAVMAGPIPKRESGNERNHGKQATYVKIPGSSTGPTSYLIAHVHTIPLPHANNFVMGTAVINSNRPGVDS